MSKQDFTSNELNKIYNKNENSKTTLKVRHLYLCLFALFGFQVLFKIDSGWPVFSTVPEEICKILLNLLL